MGKAKLEIDPITLKDASSKVTAAAKDHPEAKDNKTAQVRLIDKTLKHPPARLVSAVAKECFKVKITEAYVSNIKSTTKDKTKGKGKTSKLVRKVAGKVARTARMAMMGSSTAMAIENAVSLIENAGGVEEAKCILDSLSPLVK